jgi:poly(3-hydroxybutyrate) depolymerase
MTIPTRLAAAGLLVMFCAADAHAQALTSLSSLRTRYNTRKATVVPTGALKAEIDAIDAEIAAANRRGNLAEVRRLMARGTTRLNGEAWTGELDYANSIVLRTETVIADSSKPYAVRVEQLYNPAIELTGSLTAHARLQKPRAQAAAGAQPPPAEIVKDFGAAEGVSRDLRESPYRLALDVAAVPDGTYELTVEVMSEGRPLGTATLGVNLRKGLDRTVADLEAAASRAPEKLRADILFPVDRMRTVNRGAIEMRTFNPERDFANALEIAAAAKAGRDPFAGKTGDFKRHYLLETANEIMPYRMYVPKGYDGARAYPLIIALHGLGGTEDSFFTGYDRSFPPLVEQHGYILAAPLGYRVDGGYGWGVGNPPADAGTRRSQQASEEDVMQVLQRVREHYKIDPNRIYLMGHSLGGIGTWKVAPKFPDIWAAIAPIAGSGNPDSLARIRHVPQIVVHGDDDRTVNVRGSRAMVAKMKELGIEHRYIEVPGGSHGGVVAPNLDAILSFFDAHKKKP